jgi:hypothetical protein
MSLKCLTLAALFVGSVSVAQAQTAPANIQADCSSIGGVSLTQDGTMTGQTMSDAAFSAAKGMVTLRPQQTTYRAGFGELNYTVWQAKQKIDLGNGYAVLVYISYQNQAPAGDFVLPIHILKTSSILSFNGQPIGAGSTSVEQAQDDGEGHKVFVAAMSLDNLPLRESLGAAYSPEADLASLATNSSSLNSLFKKFGDGKGMLTQATISCSVQAQ